MNGKLHEFIRIRSSQVWSFQKALKQYSPDCPATMDDRDIYRSAKLYIKQYGADASAHAAMRAEALLACDDLDAFNVWMRIGQAIEEMQATEGRRNTNSLT